MKFISSVAIVIFCFVQIAFAESGVFAHECSNRDHTHHKVNVCHVPLGNPDNAHTICVDDDSVKVPYHGHFPGAHGGDYLGKCIVSVTPTPTIVPTVVFTPTIVPTPPSNPECPNNQAKDACGKCGGDNSSCTDCAGVINGNHVVDDCGACNIPGSPDFNTTCLGCDGVPNSSNLFDACGVCGGDNSSCKGCDGIPNSGKTVDACGVCNGQNAVCVVGCDGIPFSGKTVDDCGVCGGDGSSCHCPLHKVNIDKSSLIRKAKILYAHKAIKYFNGAASCNHRVRKWSKRESEKDLITLERFIELVNSIPDQVEVCPNQCVTLVLANTLRELKALNKKLYLYASLAQHGARNACHGKGPGNGYTKKLSNSLNRDILKCHDKNTICL